MSDKIDAIVPVGQLGVVVAVTRQIAITEKLLTQIANGALVRTEGSRLFQYFVENSHYAIQWLARFYPLTIELISIVEDKWDWEILSDNRSIPWSGELIAKFKEWWNWEILSDNRSIPWSEELIAKFEEWWDWKILSDNPSIPWSEELITKFEDRWDWKGDNHGSCGLSGNESLPWNDELIAKHEDKWDWDWLSGNQSLPWSRELIAKYEDRWEWGWLGDDGCPNNLGGNKCLPWCEQLITKYEDRWRWKDSAIGYNDDPQPLPLIVTFWSTDLIKLFSKHGEFPAPYYQDKGNKLRPLICTLAISQVEQILNKSSKQSEIVSI